MEEEKEIKLWYHRISNVTMAINLLSSTQDLVCEVVIGYIITQFCEMETWPPFSFKVT